METKNQSFLDWRIPAFINMKAKIMPVIFLTPIRAGVIVFTPLFIWLVKRIASITLNRGTQLLLSMLFISAIYGILNDTNELPNTLLALFIEAPIIYLFFVDYERINEFDYICFIKATTWILGIIDALGFFTFFFYAIRGEDSFGIPYGQHFTSVHGLSLLNTIMFIYYAFNNPYKSKLLNRLLAGYFFICFVMCFYGLGVVCLALVMGFYALTYFNIKKIIGFTIVISIAGYLVVSTNSSNIGYVEKKIDDTYAYDYFYEAPRKIRFAVKAYERFTSSPILDNIFGFGPGSYNGRVAFLLNSDADNPFTDFFGTQMPVYHASDVWIYWSKTWVSINKYNDGTINKPHSSLISILMENGLPFTLVFFFLWGRKMYMLFIKRTHGLYTSLFLIHAFFFLNFVTEQWLETSEFLFFAIFSGINLAYSKKYLEKDNIIKNEKKQTGLDMGATPLRQLWR